MRARQMLVPAALVVLSALLFSAVAERPAAASQQALTAFLPKAGEIPGWKIPPKADRYAPNSGKLHVIYDGGDGQYIKAGVIEALARTYQSGNKYLTVTVHKFGKWENAKKFYTSKEAGIKKANGYATVKVKNAGSYAPNKGLTLGYSWTGQYMVTYVATSQEATTATKSFITKIAGKMAKPG